MKTSYQKVEDSKKTYALVPPEHLAEYRQMRLDGKKKPPHLSWGDWLSIEIKGNEKNLKICTFFAAGILQKNIAEISNISESRVSLILSTSQARIMVHRLYEGLGLNELREVVLTNPEVKREHFWWGH